MQIFIFIVLHLARLLKAAVLLLLRIYGEFRNNIIKYKCKKIRVHSIDVPTDGFSTSPYTRSPIKLL